MNSVRKTFALLAVLLVLVFASLHLLSVGIQRRGARGEGFTRADRIVLAAYAPAARALSWPFRGVRRAWDGYVALAGQKSENALLRAEVDRLRAEAIQAQEARHEAEQLREYVGWGERTGRPLMMAHVVGRSYLPEVHTVLIDRGSEAGAAPGMIAATTRGLVGYVTWSRARRTASAG